MSKLHDLADALEAHLTAAELLSNNNVCVTPCQLRQLQDDREKVREIFTKLTRAAARRYDLQYLQYFFVVFMFMVVAL